MKKVAAFIIHRRIGIRKKNCGCTDACAEARTPTLAPDRFVAADVAWPFHFSKVSENARPVHASPRRAVCDICRRTIRRNVR